MKNGNEILAAILSLKDATKTGFIRVEARMDRLETRMDGLETRIDRLETRIDGLETRLEHFATRVMLRFDGVDRRLAAVEAR